MKSLNQNQKITMDNYIVYRHTSPSGKVYIGLTKHSLEKRGRHNGINYRICPYFYHAIKKYGWNNFTHEVVSSNLSKKEAIWLEKYLIAYYHSCEEEFGYNLTTGGDGTSGMTDAVRKKISKNRKGVKMSKESVAKTAAWHRGRKRSKSTCANIVNALHDFYSSEEGMLMAKARVHNRRRVVDENGVIYNSIKEAAEILMIEPSTLRKAIAAGRYTHGVLLKFV